MKASSGGTSMFCPACKEIGPCKAVSLSSLGERWEQRLYAETHNDLQWFRRGRECLGCGNVWLSCELPEDYLDELIELRDALADLKRHAKAYMQQSSAAAQSLDDLTTSLAALRALRMYASA